MSQNRHARRFRSMRIREEMRSREMEEERGRLLAILFCFISLGFCGVVFWLLTR